jgi:uncharacterized protein YjbJ (UPF0337 family)
MKLNDFTKQFSIVKNWVSTTLLLLTAIAFFWQGALLVNNVALADSIVNSSIFANTEQVQGKVNRDTGRTKNFVEETKDKVKDAARSNANKVDRATDNDSFIGRKAQRDAGRIQQKADKDAARTKGAVDDSKNVIQRTVDNIKDTFSN